VRRGKGGSDVAGIEAGIDDRVVLCRLVNQRRARRERLIDGDNRCFLIDLDLDLLGEIFGLGGALGDHRGDRLADISDTLPARIGCAIGTKSGRSSRGQSGLTARRSAAVMTLRAGRRLDREDPAAGDGTADKAHRQRAAREVGDIAAAPLQQDRVLVSRQPAPDPPHHAIA
jgi:hypothetical protein